MDFEQVYAAHVEDVYRYALSLCGNSHIAEDVTGETFLKAMKAADKFKGDCSVRVWLCQIAKHIYFNLAKRGRFTTQLPEELPSGDCFEHKLADKAQALELHRALHQLGEPYKEVFSLRVFSELSFSEIGALFGKPDGWARTTFHRAKLKLKEGIVNDEL